MTTTMPSDQNDPPNTEDEIIKIVNKALEKEKDLKEEGFKCVKATPEDWRAFFEKKQTPEVSFIGWKCPVCGAGLSPFTSRCPCTPYPVVYPTYPVYPSTPWPTPYPIWTGPVSISLTNPLLKNNQQ